MGGCDNPRRIVYNDEQYQVKLARPALVKDEPVYANNKPEHYAVSTKYPGGAISKIPAASPRRSYMTQERHQVRNIYKTNCILRGTLTPFYV